LNYGWDTKQLANSATRAKLRHRNVFVGVDCFGRGCFGGGGWNCHEAFKQVRWHDLSVALFAPGWIVEQMPHRDIIVNSLRSLFSVQWFWDRLISYVHPHPLTTLPLETNFSHGYIQDGENKRYNMSTAKLQPHYLATGVFPKSGGVHLILPGPGQYKLVNFKFLRPMHF
uniref:Mannosyl-glycoprotein endo-beta-N-acetylglucosaminidase n=1 Tax=Gongylonema pulchrum TaxID=637853 RepID=A0A183EHN0_9BILA